MKSLRSRNGLRTALNVACGSTIGLLIAAATVSACAAHGSVDNGQLTRDAARGKFVHDTVSRAGQGTRTSELACGDGECTWSGKAETKKAISTIMHELDQSRQFTSVELVSVVSSPTDSIPSFDFRMKAKYGTTPSVMYRGKTPEDQAKGKRVLHTVLLAAKSGEIDFITCESGECAWRGSAETRATIATVLREFDESEEFTGAELVSVVSNGQATPSFDYEMRVKY
jgi:hypothetical protein